MGAIGLFAGLCVHTVVDGIALGAVLIGSGVRRWLVSACFSRYCFTSRCWSIAVNERVVFIQPLERGNCLCCPLTAAGATSLAPHEGLLPAALAFAAGAFICIALGDLLPEVQFHSHDRLRLTLLFLLGVGIAFALGFLEPAH